MAAQVEIDDLTASFHKRCRGIAPYRARLAAAVEQKDRRIVW
jgi:hypothetical protein